MPSRGLSASRIRSSPPKLPHLTCECTRVWSHLFVTRQCDRRVARQSTDRPLMRCPAGHRLVKGDALESERGKSSAATGFDRHGGACLGYVAICGSAIPPGSGQQRERDVPFGNELFQVVEDAVGWVAGCRQHGHTLAIAGWVQGQPHRIAPYRTALHRSFVVLTISQAAGCLDWLCGWAGGPNSQAEKDGQLPCICIGCPICICWGICPCW